MNTDNKTPQRKNLRLHEYDYTQNNVYFVTMCCHNRKSFFGTVVNGFMDHNEYGHIAYSELLSLPNRFRNIEIDEFQIMPNHIHCIFAVGVTLAVTRSEISDTRDGASPSPTSRVALGTIIGAYKSIVACKCAALSSSKKIRMGKLWQRNYYEHIIRTEKDLNSIREYIIQNPDTWLTDEENIGAQ